MKNLRKELHNVSEELSHPVKIEEKTAEKGLTQGTFPFSSDN
jgi:hypothetical protein